MLGKALIGVGSGLAGGIADVSGISDFTSALGGEKSQPKAAKVKAFDEDESPTKILQRILTEVQTIHKVMASQVVPPSEEEEIQRDKDKKDEEVLDALGNIVPKEDKTKKKKEPWWKILWAWIKPFISWITKPISWIKSLLSLPFFIALKAFAVAVGSFFLLNPVGIALLTIGIVAINWRDIKKAIKGYVNTIKGWIKAALSAIGLGWMINEPDEQEAFADPSILEDQSPEGKDWWIDDQGRMNIMIRKGADDLTEVDDGPDPNLHLIGGDSQYKKLTTNEERLDWLDKKIELAQSPAFQAAGEVGQTQEWIDQMKGERERVSQYAGQFQTGGMIPKGKVGLAGEGEGLESIGGTMLGGPTMVEGPARVRREAPVRYGSAAHKQMQANDPTAGATTEQRQMDMDILGRGKGGALERLAAHRIGLRDWMIGGAVGGATQLTGLHRAMWDRRNVTKQAQGAFMQDPTLGQQAGRSDLGGLVKVGWDAEQLQKMIQGRSKGREAEYTPKQVTFFLAVADFGIDFAALKDINNSRIRELGVLQDAAGVDSKGEHPNWAITILNAMRQNLSSQDLTEKVEGEMRMLASRMQNLPSINESTLQQAGQQGTVTVVNQSNTQNISTASSTSKQNNIGQTQQSIPISNTHGAAPASV